MKPQLGQNVRYLTPPASEGAKPRSTDAVVIEVYGDKAARLDISKDKDGSAHAIATLAEGDDRTVPNTFFFPDAPKTGDAPTPPAPAKAGDEAGKVESRK